MRAWKTRRRPGRGQGSVRGWLLTVARNIVTDRARARAVRPAEVAEVADRPPVERGSLGVGGEHHGGAGRAGPGVAGASRGAGGAVLQRPVDGRGRRGTGRPAGYREVEIVLRPASPARRESGRSRKRRWQDDRRTTDPAGAYVLGALDAAEVREVEEHLRGLRRLPAELAELGGDEAVPRRGAAGGLPGRAAEGGDLLLQRTLASRASMAEPAAPAVAASRRPRWLMVAASVAVIAAAALGGGVLIGRETAE